MNKLNQRIRSVVLIGALTIGGFVIHGANEIKIDHLSANNTLLRVNSNSHYLMMPVQDTNEDSRINVIVDGKISETIYVRLARTKTDYSVPFDLTPYKDKQVIFEIVTPQGRNSVREAKEDACWKGFKLTETHDIVDRETKYRPLYHHTPLYGWMNDPNGMFYKDGLWHLYYQHNPYGSKWQNMTWGHSTSTDLINWQQEPIALRPDGLGAIFSGSCVIDHNNSSGYGKDAVVALYTSAATSQMQSMAVSNDNGKTFSRHASNPIITLESEARDPNMFWNDKTKEWNLVLAHALDREMLFFTSKDLSNWTLSSSFGKGEGAQEGVWECPDLFELPIEGTDEKRWVLICNLNPGGPFGGSGVQYFVGEWDGKRFKADKEGSDKVSTKWLDYGKDNYALVSWSDAPENRRTAIGWMSNWQYAAEVPTMQYRSANTLPRELGLFKASDGKLYVSSQPSPELLALRDKVALKISNATIGGKSKKYQLPTSNSGVCELEIELDSQKSDSIAIELSNKDGNRVVMKYDALRHIMVFDRTESGVVNFSEHFPAKTIAPTFENDGKVYLRIYIDRSSIEIFGNEGKFVMTNLVFPESPYDTLSMQSYGGKTIIKKFRIYSLKTK